MAPASLFSGGAFGYFSDYLIFWLLFLSLLLHTWCFFRCFPRKRRPKTALVLGNALVLFSMLGLVAICAETYLRFAAVETDAFGVSLPARRWFALHTRLNALGCRDKEWNIPKPNGVRRIALVGDSYTYGWGIKNTRDRFPDRIQAMFDQQTPGQIEVMNVAKPGWGTGDQVRPIRDIIVLYGVDEIVLCYVPNDIEKLIPTTDDFNPTRPPDYYLINLDASPLLDYLYRRLYLPRVPTVKGYHDWLADGIADPNIWAAHTAQLNEIASICREHNVTLRVVLLPFLRTGGTKFDAARFHTTLRHFFSASGIPVVDLLPIISGYEISDLVVNGHDPHPNELAHQVFAEEFWRSVFGAE